MIEILKEQTFHLLTQNTSYIFSILPSGYPEHIYYGRKITNVESSLLAIREKHLIAPCFSTYANREYPSYSLDDTLLEFSTEGKGDYRTPSIAISYGESGIRTLNFTFDSYKTYKGIKRFASSTLPQAVATDTEADTLEVCYKDKNLRITLYQIYTTFNTSDTITRREVIVNESQEPVVLRAFSSAQLDIRTDKIELISFQGDWARERHIQRDIISKGTHILDSRGLDSTAQVNPTYIINC